MSRIHELIETVDALLVQIEENYSTDLRIAKQFAEDLREELESVLETHDE